MFLLPLRGALPVAQGCKQRIRNPRPIWRHHQALRPPNHQHQEKCPLVLIAAAPTGGTEENMDTQLILMVYFFYKSTNNYRLLTMLLAMKEPVSPSTASWATLTPAPRVEVQATNRSCSPWVATRAEATLPAPRSTWRTSESIAESSRAERKGQMEAGKMSRARKRTPGIKCSRKVELYGSMLLNDGLTLGVTSYAGDLAWQGYSHSKGI